MHANINSSYFHELFFFYFYQRFHKKMPKNLKEESLKPSERKLTKKQFEIQRW